MNVNINSVPTICAVIVLYNPLDDEINNIKTYLESVDYCIIIDNSDINNGKLIEKNLGEYLEKIRYCKQENNIGLCAALNKALQMAMQENYDWILTMNSDSYFKNDMIKVYKKYLRDNNNEKILLLGPQYNYDRHIVEEKEYFKEVNWLMMSGNLVNVKNAISIGGYKEEFFVDGLDCEFCIRGKSLGYKIIECGEAILEHMPAETKEFKILGLSLIKYGIASPLRYYYQSRSTWWIFRKYHSISMMKIMIVKLFKILFLFSNKCEYLKKYCEGIRDSYKIPLT